MTPAPHPRSAGLPAALGLLLLAATPCAAQPTQPFRGEVLDLVAEAEAVRSGPTLEAREAAAARFLETLSRDPFLAEVGPRLGLERWLRDLAQGGTFDAARFRAAAAAEVARTELRAEFLGEAEMLQKLRVLERALATPAANAPRARGTPIDAEEVARNAAVRILGERNTRVLALEAVHGAELLMLNDRLPLPAGESRERVALDLYGRVVAPEGAGAGSASGEPSERAALRAGLAHREVGRAVLGPELRHPLGAVTADVLKGVGPTPWAANGNRFNSKATGTFPLAEAVRDWNKSEALHRAGVAVAEPVAIVSLPYMEWNDKDGWRPVSVYVRRPRENLRVSDLDHLSARGKRRLLESLRGKIAAELAGVARSGQVTDLDVIRHFVERAGRTAGLFQGGIGGGRTYFHGMLHDQNVTLLGEIVDVGNGEGRLDSREAMRRAWAESNYAWWPERLSDYRGMRGDVETLLFDRMARRVNAGFASVTDGGLPEAELKELFAKAYREGRRGVSARDPARLLTIATEAAGPRASTVERYRRADGTLDWSRLTRDRALREGAGLAHFALALFLKEVAAVAATGDRVRIEEFFDGLLTTDFYAHYGLFVAGARVGEVAYVRYLQRYVKPRFVNGLLKTNLVLAAGMALPLIVEGRFEGRAFAISVGALGLSSAAVKSGVAGIKWVTDLATARRSGALARLGAGAGRLARLGGWFYTAAELAVVLYVAEEVDQRVTAALDHAAARAALAEAGHAFLAAARQAASDAELATAADAYHAAWIAYRDFLYQPLHADEALLALRLERLARQAKLASDRRRAIVEWVAGQPALRARLEASYGSLQAYSDHLLRGDEAELEADVSAVLDSYDRDRTEHLRAIYEDGARGEPLLAKVDHLEWLLAGAAVGSPGDPYGDRGDLPARLGRSRARAALEGALSSPSSNRLEAYADEADVLNAVADSLRARGRADLARVLDERVGVVRTVEAADRALMDGDGLIDTRRAARGLVGAAAAAAGD